MSQDILPSEREAETPDWHYIDLFRVIRAAGNSDAAKARAAAEYVASEVSTARAEALEEAANKARDLYLFPPPTSRAARFHQRVTQDAISDAIRALVSDDGGIHG